MSPFPIGAAVTARPTARKPLKACVSGCIALT